MKYLNLSELNALERGHAALYENSFAQDEADALFNQLKGDEIRWGQEHLKIYGKEIPFPRQTAWYGDPGCNYSYSGITMTPHTWTSSLTEIKERVEVAAETKFNSVLLNLYRGGTDSMSWHSDAEPELGTDPIIASVSFGEARPFQLRLKKDKSVKAEILLTHGSLLVMSGAFQHYWQHQIPKTTKPLGARINLTFRRIVSGNPV